MPEVTKEQRDKRDAEMNAAMADGIIGEIGELLAAQECVHGKSSHKNTPPMMYPEWIACVMVHQRTRLVAKVRALGCLNGWGAMMFCKPEHIEVCPQAIAAILEKK